MNIEWVFSSSDYQSKQQKDERRWQDTQTKAATCRCKYQSEERKQLEAQAKVAKHQSGNEELRRQTARNNGGYKVVIAANTFAQP